MSQQFPTSSSNRCGSFFSSVSAKTIACLSPIVLGAMLLSAAPAQAKPVKPTTTTTPPVTTTTTPPVTTTTTPPATTTPNVLGTKSFSATGKNTYDGSNDPLAASVLFNYLQGGLLSVTLSNTSAVGISNPSDVLTSVFWDYNGSPLSLSMASATAPIVTSSGGTKTTNNVNLLGSLNEWKLPNTGIAGGDLPGISQSYGVGTAGLGIFQGGGGQQFNYGIISGYQSNANNAVKSGTFVNGSATFLLSGLMSGFDVTKIGNIRFQYGTSLAEASLTPLVQIAPPPKAKVPEPSAIAALTTVVLGVMKSRRKSA